MHPRIMVAGTASGVGKTSVTLGITAALQRRGHAVQPFKVGPDFLDPLWLSAAAQRTCYNLDGWMTGKNYVQQLFRNKAEAADIAVIEGVMGMFDGSSPASRTGSTAEVAAWLHAPVILVVDAWGIAGSIAPLVNGFATFDRDCRLVGVIANRCASPGHADLLRQALAEARLPPLIGGIPRGALPELPERHLGLIPGSENQTARQVINQLGEACEQYLDLEQLESLAAYAPDLDTPAEDRKETGKNSAATSRRSRETIRIGIARDSAFLFYYPDNLELLTAYGAELVDFSPLCDTALPGNIAGIYLGGGYPELHLETLAENRAMRQAIAEFAAAGRVIYAECGGMMYLSQGISNDTNNHCPMCGVLPCTTRMLPSLQSLGYRETETAGNTILGPRGTRLRGHEFRYSRLDTCPSPLPPPWQPAYTLAPTPAAQTGYEGFRSTDILASYVHQHFGTTPEATASFVEACRRCGKQ